MNEQVSHETEITNNTPIEQNTSNNNSSNKTIITIRNIIIFILLGVIVFNIIKLFGGFSGVSGENIKYYSKSENAVYVYSVCPECGHVGDIWEAKISSGEDCSSYEICERCDHMFEITVKRD